MANQVVACAVTLCALAGLAFADPVNCSKITTLQNDIDRNRDGEGFVQGNSFPGIGYAITQVQPLNSLWQLTMWEREPGTPLLFLGGVGLLLLGRLARRKT